MTYVIENYIRSEVARRSWQGSAITDANGDATFDIPAGYFNTVISVVATPIRATTTDSQYVSTYIRTQSVTQVVCRLIESKSTGILIGGTVEGLETGPSGITIYLQVMGT